MVSSRIFDGRQWKYLPTHKRIVDVQHFIFNALSRVGCAAQENFFLPHKQFLTTDFGDVSVVNKTVHARRFGAACVAKCKVAGFDDPERKIVFQQVAQSVTVGHCGHWRHASLPRMLKSVVTTPTMSAQVVGRSRRRGVVSAVAARHKRSEMATY